MATLTAQRTKRVPASRLGRRIDPNPQQALLFQEPQAIQPPEPPEEPAPVLSGSTALRHLTSKNPALLTLIDTLDLVEVRSSPIRPEPLPPLREFVPTEPLNPKLEEIAQRTFARNRAYDEEEAITRLSRITATTPDRARSGITRMQAQGIIALTGSSQYYLSNSTPF